MVSRKWEQRSLKVIVFLLTIISTSVLATPVKIVSYNTFLLPGYTLRRTNQNVRAHLIGKYFADKNVDIICFQEIYRPKYFWAIKRMLKEAYPYDTGLPVKSWFKPANSGLVVFSKYPITSKVFYRFTNLIAADQFSSKGYQLLKIKLGPDKYIKLVNAHLQANEGPDYAEIRKEQLRLIFETSQSDHFSRDYPMVIAGDLNVNKFSDEFQSLLDIFEIDNYKLDGNLRYTYDPKVNTFLRNKTAQFAYDYILLKKNNSTSEVLTRLIFRPRYYNTSAPRLFNPSKDRNDLLLQRHLHSLSDHFGISAVIDIKP